MRKYLQNIAFLLLSTGFFLLMWHMFFINQWSLVEWGEKKTWMWGDSQVVEGLSPEGLIGLDPVYSAAYHGNGFYDLISFANRLPDSSTAIVGLGPVFYRLNRDRSESGLFLNGFKAMGEAAQTKDVDIDSKKLIRGNISHEFSLSNLGSAGHGRYGNKPDTAKRTKSIVTIGRLLQEKDLRSVVDFKNKWLYYSLDEISAKSKHLYIVSMPVCEEMGSSSFATVQSQYDSTINDLSVFLSMPIDTIWVEAQGDPFHDAIHFSGQTNDEVTATLNQVIVENPVDRIIVIRIGAKP